MHRRDFVAGSLGASIAPALGQTSPGPGPTTQGGTGMATPQILELRRYQFRMGPMAARHAEYAKNALVPAMNRQGIKPVGAFTVSVGSQVPATYLLLAHPSADSAVTLGGRLTQDAEYKQAGASFRSLPFSDPPYVRRDSWLMLAFTGFPRIEVPAGPVAVPGRVFELRTYESHNETAGLKKIEMFDQGGEVPIFRRVGITPVFFGRNVVGNGMPSLTYLTVFPDMAAREKAWAAFGADPDWVKLRSEPAYADIVSNIRIEMLRPADYSQI
jgi:NIPSNAP protein